MSALAEVFTGAVERYDAAAPSVVMRVREALAEAELEGRRAPGRPTLVKLTGARENQVREALESIRQQQRPATEDLASAGEPLVPVVEPAGEPLVPVVEPAGEPLATTEDGALPDAPPAVASSRPPRAWPLAVIALGAAVAVWSGWVGLGELTGFGVVRLLPGIWDGLRLNTAVVLPLSVECYGAYALRCWLGAVLSDRTRAFARRSAVTSLVIGAGAQVAYHLMVAAGVHRAPWPVVVLVSCVPVVVLGLASALARLVTSDHQPAASARVVCAGDYGQ